MFVVLWLCKWVLLVSMFLFAHHLVSAQTTQFSYQGHLTNGSVPANGTYDFQFQLWNGPAGGTQLGPTQTITGVPVADGVFHVFLDFGFQFNGANCWLQIFVRQAGSPMYTTLNPRKPISTVPYAVRSLFAALASDATQLGGINANQYVLTNDPRMTDARPPTAGSANYIQNTTVRHTANFNISGDGQLGGSISAASVNAAAQYNIGGSRVLSVSADSNLFVGVGTGVANTTGIGNSFVGRGAGAANTSGNGNSFFGSFAGLSNTSGGSNAFFGGDAGRANTGGGGNSFFGDGAGLFNTIGGDNAFFGRLAGSANTTGNGSSFFGGLAGKSNIGSFNSFFGYTAGEMNTTGSDNAFFGVSSGTLNVGGSNNSFFGSNAGLSNVNASKNSFFGFASGAQNTSGTENAFFGYAAGSNNISGNNNTFFGSEAGLVSTGDNNTFVGRGAGDSNTTGSNNTIIGTQADVLSQNLVNATAIGAGTIVSQNNSVVLGNNANVGIGTSAPKAKLEVRGGNIYIAMPNSLIITSPNGACWFITVNNSGALSTIPVTCPN